MIIFTLLVSFSKAVEADPFLRTDHDPHALPYVLREISGKKVDIKMRAEDDIADVQKKFYENKGFNRPGTI